jgi:hypothetical protein
MDTSIIVTVVSTAGSIFLAALTFYLTKRHQTKTEWQKEKVNHYKVLLSALSDLAVDGTNKDDANKRFALAVNTICLVAPQYVIHALMEFHNEVKFSNTSRTVDRHDELLRKLMLAIRRDIDLSGKDNQSSFDFHLIGSKSVRNKGGGT